MNKKIVYLLTLILTFGTMCIAAPQQDTSNTAPPVLDKETIYYPNANIDSAIEKYKNKNYSGCLQELFSLVKQDPSNALAYYYMAMAYTYVDMQADAIEAYEKVISLNPNSQLVSYATRGRDCLTGGPTCPGATVEGMTEGASNGETSSNQNSATEQANELDAFINAPYGNGLSPQLNEEMRKKELKNIQKEINKGRFNSKDVEKLEEYDFENENFDKSSSNTKSEENLKIAQVSDEEILKAVKTLKDAGLNLTIQPENPYAMPYQDPQMAEMSMLLGGNNNNNSMMNMLPMLMTQAQKGENIDPRFMQAMMMNSMMSDISFTNNKNDRY